MNIPQYWSKATHSTTKNGKKITITRYGWSDESYKDAYQHALNRCMEVEVTSSCKRRESIKNYDTLPIREQIIQEYPQFSAKATINSYGATCLNVPNVMILDIDKWSLETIADNKKPQDISPIYTVLIVVAIVIITMLSNLPLIATFFLCGLVSWILASLTSYINNKKYNNWLTENGGYIGLLEKSLANFLTNYPTFSFNLYQTPNGYRLICLQDLFNANDELTQVCFRELPIDPLYVKMCQLQDCFRVRVTGKPWRMGINDKPNKYIWKQPSELSELEQERQKYRQEWLADYSVINQGYRACKFIKRIGNLDIAIDKQVKEFIALHDKLCQCEKDLPLA